VQRNSHVIGRLFEAMIRTEHFFQPLHDTGTTDEIGIASVRNDNYSMVREAYYCEALLRTLWNPLAD
jgi:hypothetical protein